MPDEPPKTFRVFFSWQSDLPQLPTTLAIRAALKAAKTQMKEKYGVDVIVEEATSNVSGSPYIPGEIALKISKSDVFIGDMTSIHQFDDGGKSLPNPNVTFELGAASALLGWYRVVMLFNEAIAQFANLPFDFDRHRISKYRMKDNAAHISSKAEDLAKLMFACVEAVFLDNPARPRDLEGKTVQQIQRERDLVMIKRFMRQINTQMMDVHLNDAPEHLHYFAGFMHDGLREVINNVDFELYDKDAQRLMEDIYNKLGETLKYDQYYREINASWVQSFGIPGKFKDYKEEVAAAAEIRRNLSLLRASFSAFLKKLRDTYVEFDSSETDRMLKEEYLRTTAPLKG